MNHLKKIIKENRLLYGFFLPFVNAYRYVFFFYLRNKKFKENGTAVLIAAKNALDSIGLHYWLDFGTLLGVFRDQKLLPNDLDIDLGVFLSDYSAEIERTMFKHGFKLIKEYEIDNKKYGLEQTYERDGVTVDLFYYSYRNDIMYCHCFKNYEGYSFTDSIKIKGGMQPIEQYLPKADFRQMLFEGQYFNVPDDTHYYLVYHYGQDYIIPRKWDYCDLENDNKNAKLLTNKTGKVIVY